MDKIEELFDYQRFCQKFELGNMIKMVESKYSLAAEEISDDELDLSAAGDIFLTRGEKKDDHAY